MGSASGVRAGRAFVEVGMKDELTGAMKGLEKRFRSRAAALGKIGAGLFRSGAAIVGPGLAAIAKFAETGDELNKLSARTRISVESLSQLGFAAEQSGTSLKSVGQAIFRMQRRIGNAASETGPAVRALKELGLSAKELSELNPEEQFFRIADALNEIPNKARASQLGFEILGDNFRDLVPLMADGRAGIIAYMKEAEKLGISISTEQATAAAAFADAWNKVKVQLAAVALQVGAALVPALKEILVAVVPMLKNTIDWIKANTDLVVSVVKTGAAVAAAGLLISGFAFASLAASVAIRGVTAAIAVYRLGLKATAATTAFLLGLSGPVGWAVIAGGVLIAVGAIAVMNDQLEETETAATAAAEKLKDVEKAAAKIKGGGGGGKVDVPDFGVAGPVILTPMQQLQKIIKDTISPTEKLHKELFKISRMRIAFDDLMFNRNASAFTDDAREAFRRLEFQAIEAGTGIFSAMQSINDQIRLLAGTATQAGLELEKMAAKGAPPELLARMQELLRIRKELEQQNQDKRDIEAGDQRNRSEAESIAKAVQNPQERFQAERKRLTGLRNKIDPQTGKAFLDPETFQRALKKAFETAMNALGKSKEEKDPVDKDGRVTDPIGARSKEGQDRILAALQGIRGASPEKDTADNTKKTNELLAMQNQKIDKLIKKVQPVQPAKI